MYTGGHLDSHMVGHPDGPPGNLQVRKQRSRRFDLYPKAPQQQQQQQQRSGHTRNDSKDSENSLPISPTRSHFPNHNQNHPAYTLVQRPSTSASNYHPQDEPSRPQNGHYNPHVISKRPSEASRLRALNNGYTSQSSDGRRTPEVPSENYSRARGPSARQRNESPRPTIHPSKTFPIARPESPNKGKVFQDRLTENEPSRERGISISSSKDATTHPPPPLRPAMSIPDYHTAGHIQPRVRGFPSAGHRGGAGRDYNRPDSNVSSVHRLDPIRTNEYDSEEVRSSFRSALTTNSSYMGTSGTERSSVLTKSSSRTSIFGKDEGLSVDDAIGMYEDGFADSAVEEDYDTHAELTDNEEPPHAPMIRQIVDENGALAVPKMPALITRDSAQMFGGNAFEGPPSEHPYSSSRPCSPTPLPANFSRPSSPAPPLNRPSSPVLFERRPDTSPAPETRPESLNKLPPSPMYPPQPQSSALPPPSPGIPGKLFPAPTLPLTAPIPRAQTLIGASPGAPYGPLRDRYGFKKVSQHITMEQYEAWNVPYTEFLMRRRKKWIALMREGGIMTEKPNRFPPRSAKVKRFVRKGIPPEWRGQAWFYYAGGPAMVAKHPGLYDTLIEKAGSGRLSPTDKELIERDLNRTFPDNIKFKPDPPADAPLVEDGVQPPPEPETETLQSLRRVLQAFSVYNPKIGYCQSLNFLAGLLLVFMDEEKSFWMLNIITRVYLPGTHEVNLEGANVDLGVLMMSIKDSMPAIWAKIGGELDGTAGDGKVSMRLPPITLCTTAWFMSCFIGTLPIETTLRVWDSFFYEGSKTLFRIALAIFKVGEAEIRAVSDPMEIFQVVQTIPRRLIDASALMEACFRRRNGFGHLSQETIEYRRAERRQGYAEERAKATGVPLARDKSNRFKLSRRANKEEAV